MAPSLVLLLVLLTATSAPLTPALPIVDPGLFVIMGVKTCRSGDGYCILGNNCTLDEDFLPDDRGGHCDGLRSAFTPSAEFICCRYNAEPTTSPDTVTTTSPAEDEMATSTSTSPAEDLEHREANTEATTLTDATTETTDVNFVTENTISDTKQPGSGLVKRTRINEAEKFLVTVSEIPPSDGTEKSEQSSFEQNVVSHKDTAHSVSKDGVMAHDILKLITEGEWQINEVGEPTAESHSFPDATTTTITTTASDGSDTTTQSALPLPTDAFVEKEIIVGATQRDNTTIAEKVFESVCVGDPNGDPNGDEDGDCWFVRFVDTRSDSLICHGAFIDESRVITSAVCAIRIYDAGVGRVRVRSPEGEPLSLRSVAVHQDFRPKDIEVTRHDVGLVVVNREQRSRSNCSICFAAPEQTLNASSCYTLAGNDDVTKHPCREIGSSPEEDGAEISLTCSLSEKTEQIHSGTPLICGQTLAGVAFTSPKETAFTPSAQLLPWVRWNLQKTTS